MKKTQAILYVPSDTPEAMTMAAKRVGGVPVIVRGIMTLMQAGIERIALLIAESQRETIESFLRRYSERHLPELEFIHYDEPYRVSPDVIRTIAAGLDNRCLLINANLLFEAELIRQIRSVPIGKSEVIVCREGVHPLPIIDINAESFAGLVSFTEEKPRSIESCLKFLFETQTERVAQKSPLLNTFLVRRRRDRAVAETFLTESIRHSTTGPIAKYINKRISLPFSLIMSKLWISPNSVTAINIIIGLFSGVFIADGHRYDIILLGAALFQIASIVDGCDGEIAKLTFRCSKFGQYIDSISDNLSLGSFMIGLIAGYWRHTHSPTAFYVGAIMISTTAITFFWMIRYLKNNTQSASLVTFDKEYLQKLTGKPAWLMSLIRYGKMTLKKDMFSFMFFMSALGGFLYWWLFIATFGTTVAAIILTYLNAQDILKAKLEGEAA